jgi:hypothetical protein
MKGREGRKELVKAGSSVIMAIVLFLTHAAVCSFPIALSLHVPRIEDEGRVR